MSETTAPLVLPAYPQGYQIETERLKLRPPEKSDADALFPLMSDPRLSIFLAWAPHQYVAETGRLIESLISAQQVGQGFHWVVLESGRIAGLVSLIDVRRQHRSWTLNRAELAYWTGVAHQSKGYATEAATAVTAYGFEHLHLHKIRVYHAIDNPESGRVIEKLGFRWVGDEHDAFRKNGVWHHLRSYELTANEFMRFNNMLV